MSNVAMISIDTLDMNDHEIYSKSNPTSDIDDIKSTLGPLTIIELMWLNKNAKFIEQWKPNKKPSKLSKLSYEFLSKTVQNAKKDWSPYLNDLVINNLTLHFKKTAKKSQYNPTISKYWLWGTIATFGLIFVSYTGFKMIGCGVIDLKK